MEISEPMEQRECEGFGRLKCETDNSSHAQPGHVNNTTCVGLSSFLCSITTEKFSWAIAHSVIHENKRTSYYFGDDYSLSGLI
jgi:hypothetical protein